MSREERLVVFASSLGTAFAWYDFLIFASLSSIIGQKFFAALSPDWAFIVALITYSVGYIVRPLGAIVFGPVGDLTGRKHTFLITVSIMGATTFLARIIHALVKNRTFVSYIKMLARNHG